MENNNYVNVPTPSKESDKSLTTSVKYLFVGLAIFVLWGVLQIVDVQVDDRETYMQETIDEVGNSWSSDQILAGPVISYDRVTFVKSYGKDRHGKDSLIVRENSTTNLLFPEDLLVKCDVDSKSLHRSIYDVSVYSTKAEFSGKFTIPEELLGPDVRNIRVRMSVSDLKGIFEQVFVNLDTVKYQLNPNEGASSSKIQSVEESVEDVIGALYETKSKKKKKNKEIRTEVLDSPVILKKGMVEVPFTATLAIKGSNSLSFYPVGDATTVEVKSLYNNPSFMGDFLPIDRNVDDKGFSALWKVLKINRSNPYGVTFGVNLLQPVTQYQKTSRSIKYGILVILLVFLAAVVTELVTKKRINILQYVIVGLSLVLFYLLLLSFSDFISFGKSYLIATVMTTIALTAYFKGILKHKSAYLLGALVFVFLIISYIMMQLQVYSLLTGSLLLFVILCVIMYLTRNMSSKKEELPETKDNKQ